jgi:hypothetical protein
VNSISEMVQFEFLYFKGSSAVPSTIQLFGWETKYKNRNKVIDIIVVPIIWEEDIIGKDKQEAEEERIAQVPRTRHSV